MHSDISNKVLTVSSHAIVPMNADFDGDILNLYRIISKDLIKIFDKNLNPRYNLNISRMNGKANREMLPIKDELTSFWGFVNL